MGIISNLQQLVNNERPRDLMLGRVISISLNTARILLIDGTTVPYARIISGLKQDDQVVIARPVGSPDWIVLTVINHMEGRLQSVYDKDAIIVPIGLTGYNTGALGIWTWSMRPEFVGTFELQISTVVGHADAISIALPRGSTFTYPVTAETWVRLRSVTSNQIISDWTDWESCGTLTSTWSDTTAIHENIASEISAVSEKGTPVDADVVLIEDSADSYNKKRVQLGNIPIDGDSIETAAADYAASSSIIGFSSYTSKHIYYWTINDTVFVAFSISGNSNSATLTFTVPYTCSSSQGEAFSLTRCADNGSILAAPGFALLPGGANTVAAYSTLASAGWTASGNKYIQGILVYKKV